MYLKVCVGCGSLFYGTFVPVNNILEAEPFLLYYIDEINWGFCDIFEALGSWDAKI